jgi:hypothetical protein
MNTTIAQIHEVVMRHDVLIVDQDSNWRGCIFPDCLTSTGYPRAGSGGLEQDRIGQLPQALVLDDAVNQVQDRSGRALAMT